jgi:hypothetical protein
MTQKCIQFLIAHSLYHQFIISRKIKKFTTDLLFQKKKI